MPDATPTPYDKVLYPGYTHSQTHPDRLATMATLFGMKPAPVERCRVLELGCGDGSNLVPMALSLPESKFVGIDLAPRPVAKGQKIVEALGLQNITLRPLDLLDVSADLGQFDYIIAHGVYAWVPPAVQDKILAVCRENLAPDGVAFVSYNAYPGAHLRDMVREMMLFHIQHLTDPQERIQQATALAGFLSVAQPFSDQSDTYRLFLKETMEGILNYRPGHLYHDELAEISSPVYFHQFIEHAARHDLVFLSEADFFEMQDHIFPPEVTDTLRKLAKSSIILKEQYMDFLKCRRFRQTLLCHKGISLDRSLPPERVKNFNIATTARPVSPAPDLSSSSVEEFRTPKGARMATDYPLAKAAMMCLGEIYPQSLHFNELVKRARSRLGDSGHRGHDPEETGVLAEILWGTYTAGVIELHVYTPRCAEEVSERPVASPLARLQVQSANGEAVVATLRHVSVNVEDMIGQQLLLLLDGTRDRAALLDELAAFVKSSVAAKQQRGEAVVDLQKALDELSNELDQNLAKLARLGLLIA